MELFKILIVDDEVDNIKSIFNYIADSNEPYVIYQALNGKQALKIAINECPDLIITDWEMPGMNGIELIKKLKSNENTSEIPIIMCTGIMTTSDNLQSALFAGAVDYLRKPIDKTELIARLKSTLEISESRKVIKEKLSIIEQNNKFILSLLQNIPHPFVYYTFNGKIISANERFSNLCGMETDLLINNSVYEKFDKENSLFHINQDIKLKTENKQISYEITYQDIDYIFCKSLFYTSNTEYEGIMCLLTDISEIKKIHNEIVENKKKELTTSTLRLIQMNELFDNLKAELLELYKNSNPKNSEIINNILLKFSFNTSDNFWKEFQYRFESVHESFYKQLIEKFPDLTPGEKKLCALLRLNLSSKDIATITSQNSQSVDMARYRLRKKMNLKQEINLIEFLLNLG